jgi:hypothetical protein
VFGNVNNRSSMINKVRSEGRNRLFFVLEQLHTLPNVSYLAKVRNAPNSGDHMGEIKKAHEGTDTHQPAAHEPAAH